MTRKNNIMKNTDFMLAEKIKEKLVTMAIEDKFPLDLNDLDMSGILDQSRKDLLKDELYVKNIKLENLSEFVCAEDIDDLMSMLEILETHQNKDDVVDWVDGITMVEKYEYTFLVKDLLEEITPVGVTF